MKILLSIIFNALILYALYYFLWANPDRWIENWIIVEWWINAFIVGWAILWIMNITVRKVLQLLSIPLFFLFLWLVAFVINWIILWLLDYIFNQVLNIPWIWYSINWSINFIIAVAIFTILNMFYSLLFSKK